MEKFVDYEAEKLYRLIENKKKYLETLQPDKMQYKHLLSEIEFLEQDIMPIVLYKNIYISEINKWVDTQILKAAKFKLQQRVAGLLMYLHLRDPKPYENKDELYTPVLFLTNNKELIPPADMMINISKDPHTMIFSHLVPLEITDNGKDRQNQ